MLKGTREKFFFALGEFHFVSWELTLLLRATSLELAFCLLFLRKVVS